MINGLNYIVESSLLLALLLLFYQVVLSKEKCITYNRFYLLGAGLASTLLPILNIPFVNLFQSNSRLEQVYEIPAIVSQITTFPEPKKYGLEAFTHFVTIVYMLGVVVMCMFFLIKLSRVFYLIKNAPNPVNKGRYRIVLTHRKLPTFSFGNYLFLNETGKSAQELESIIKHEEAHIQQKHSYDILFFEIYKVFFWFNPLSYQLTKAVKLNHEFLADRFAIQATDESTYINTLLTQVYQNTISPVVHYFGLHSSEKRIQMIKQNINLSTLYKPYFSFLFLGILIFSFSCHFQPETIAPISLGKTMTPKQFEDEIGHLKKIHPDRNYYFRFTANPELEQIKAYDYNRYTIDYMAAVKNNKEVFGMIYSFDKFLILPQSYFSTHTYSYQEVSEIPTPWNGYEALMETIDKQANTLAKNISEDKVVWVRFVVNTFGEVVHINIVNQNYNTMTNKEALEYGAAIKAITATSNQWRIGKVNDRLVDVEMELPIRLYKD